MMVLTLNSLKFAIKRIGKDCRGGAAIEYVVVSIFGLLMAMGAVSFVAKTLKAHMEKMEEKTGIEFDDNVLSDWE